MLIFVVLYTDARVCARVCVWKDLNEKYNKYYAGHFVVFHRI